MCTVRFILLATLPEVQVGNWKNWQPDKGSDIEKLRSDLTPEEVEKLASEIPIDDDNDLIDMEETIIVDM